MAKISTEKITCKDTYPIVSSVKCCQSIQEMANYLAEGYRKLKELQAEKLSTNLPEKYIENLNVFATLLPQVLPDEKDPQRAWRSPYAAQLLGLNENLKILFESLEHVTKLKNIQTTIASDHYYFIYCHTLYRVIFTLTKQQNFGIDFATRVERFGSVFDYFAPSFETAAWYGSLFYGGVAKLEPNHFKEVLNKASLQLKQAFEYFFLDKGLELCEKNLQVIHASLDTQNLTRDGQYSVLKKKFQQTKDHLKNLSDFNFEGCGTEDRVEEYKQRLVALQYKYETLQQQFEEQEASQKEVREQAQQSVSEDQQKILLLEKKLQPYSLEKMRAYQCAFEHQDFLKSLLQKLQEQIRSVEKNTVDSNQNKVNAQWYALKKQFICYSELFVPTKEEAVLNSIFKCHVNERGWHEPKNEGHFITLSTVLSTEFFPELAQRCIANAKLEVLYVKLYDLAFDYHKINSEDLKAFLCGINCSEKEIDEEMQAREDEERRRWALSEKGWRQADIESERLKKVRSVKLQGLWNAWDKGIVEALDYAIQSASSPGKLVKQKTTDILENHEFKKTRLYPFFEKFDRQKKLFNHDLKLTFLKTLLNLIETQLTNAEKYEQITKDQESLEKLKEKRAAELELQRQAGSFPVKIEIPKLDVHLNMHNISKELLTNILAAIESVFEKNATVNSVQYRKLSELFDEVYLYRQQLAFSNGVKKNIEPELQGLLDKLAALHIRFANLKTTSSMQFEQKSATLNDASDAILALKNQTDLSCQLQVLKTDLIQFKKQIPQRRKALIELKEYYEHKSWECVAAFGEREFLETFAKEVNLDSTQSANWSFIAQYFKKYTEIFEDDVDVLCNMLTDVFKQCIKEYQGWFSPQTISQFHDVARVMTHESFSSLQKHFRALERLEALQDSMLIKACEFHNINQATLQEFLIGIGCSKNEIDQALRIQNQENTKRDQLHKKGWSQQDIDEQQRNETSSLKWAAFIDAWRQGPVACIDYSWNSISTPGIPVKQTADELCRNPVFQKTQLYPYIFKYRVHKENLIKELQFKLLVTIKSLIAQRQKQVEEFEYIDKKLTECEVLQTALNTIDENIATIANNMCLAQQHRHIAATLKRVDQFILTHNTWLMRLIRAIALLLHFHSESLPHRIQLVDMAMDIQQNLQTLNQNIDAHIDPKSNVNSDDRAKLVNEVHARVNAQHEKVSRNIRAFIYQGHGWFDTYGAKDQLRQISKTSCMRRPDPIVLER